MNPIELRRSKSELVARGREIVSAAENEHRDLTGEERANYDAIIADARGLSERIARMDALESLGSGTEQRALTPALGLDPVALAADHNPRNTPEYRNVYRRWLAHGFASMSPAEQRALSTVDAAGGFMMAPLEVVNDVIIALNNSLFIRNLATKYTLNGAKSLGVPNIATDIEDATPTAESVAADEDTALAFGRRELLPYALTKRLKVSNKLLRNVPNADDIVTDRMSYKFGVTLEKQYMSGNGTNAALGIFTADAAGIPAASNVAAASATAIVVDDFIKAKYALNSAYWAKAAWVMHPDSAFRLATQREGAGTGQYLWRESARAGEPDVLLGRPVYVSAYAPNTFTTGLPIAVFGDFSYYWIADSLDFGIQRLSELYAETDETGFIGRLESDGAPVSGDAFRRLIMG